MIKLSGNARMLAVVLIVYIILDILLTPLGGLETRPAANVTTLGFVSVGLLFIGLALSLASLILLFHKPKRSPILAIVGAVLYFPAFFADQTGSFSTLRPPAGINSLELVQVVIAIVAIVLATRIHMEKTVMTPGP